MCFLFGLIKIFSFQNRKKLSDNKFFVLIDKNAHVHLHMSFFKLLLFFFFFCLFLFWATLPLLLIFFQAWACLFFFFFLLGNSVASFLFSILFFFLLIFQDFGVIFFFLTRRDYFWDIIFIFLINLGDCSIFIVICHFFFCFNWASLFNKGI